MKRHTGTAFLLASALASTFAASAAHAEPYRLRADALTYSRSADSPVGLIVLQGEDRSNRWVGSEAVVWAGNGASSGDALVLMVRVHDPRNWAEIRLGRQILTTGAVRPIHLDGADVRGRFPTGTSIEAFGGIPVEPQFAYRPYAWATGGRIAQSIGRSTTLGASYLQRRDDGRLAYEEAGVDFASSPAPWFDIATHGAYDLVNPGLTEATTSVAGRFSTLRPELYAIFRSPSRLLPATSLFSALGDTPSKILGGAVPWHMFPRLDVVPFAGARIVSGDVGLEATLRTTLRFDDKGEGAIMLEMRRQDAGLERFSGVRTALRVPLTPRLRCSWELELVAPDDSRGRGKLWPWGLFSMRWSPTDTWAIAGAIESSSTPRNLSEVNAIVRLTGAWGAR